jgi:deazaflavin-dependent oxidoreductase (nitroreductase family)
MTDANAMNDFNATVIAEFRSNGGKVGGQFEGAPMVLITHTGAKSGIERTTPLVFTADGDNVVIIASKAGAPTNPAWYLNMIANPTVTVETGTETYRARVTEATGNERRRLYDAQATLMPNFAEYQAKTTREIPVLLLERIPG